MSRNSPVGRPCRNAIERAALLKIASVQMRLRNGVTLLRNGVTLLELLVVIFIAVLLAAAATRLMRPALENSQVREAGRIVSTMLGTARTQAMENRRSAGLMFIPAKNNPNAAMDLAYVQVPPPYAGDSLSSRIRIKAAPVPVAASNPPAAVFTVDFPQADAWYSTDPKLTQVTVGNTLQFNHQGHIFRVDAIDVSDPDNPKLTLSCPTIARWPQQTAADDPGMTFQFSRSPRRSSGVPVQLPVGSVVDILASGVGDGSFVPNATQPVMVTFSPSGQLDMVYSPAFPQGQKVSQNVYFLVGRPEGAGNSDNLKDLRCAWVSIVCQTGMVGIAENAKVGAGTPDVAVPADRKSARRLAATGTSMGG